jgi:hypothetical protein
MNANQPREDVFRLRSWSHQKIALVRVGVGIWLLLLTAILYSAGVGGPWELLLVGTAASHFGLAYRLLRIAKHDPNMNLRFR